MSCLLLLKLLDDVLAVHALADDGLLCLVCAAACCSGAGHRHIGGSTLQAQMPAPCAMLPLCACLLEAPAPAPAGTAQTSGAAQSCGGAWSRMRRSCWRWTTHFGTRWAVVWQAAGRRAQ